MKKISTLLCMLIVVFGLGVFTSGAAEASVDAPRLKIEAGNLSFEETVKLVYAVSYENVVAENIKMLYWTESKEKIELYVKGTEQYSSSPLKNDAAVSGKSCKTFKYDNIWAKEMTDTIYARAYVEEDGVIYYSNVVKYSIIQYAYNMLGYTAEGTNNEDLKNTLVKMLEYGAASQIQFNYKVDTLATDNFSKIELIGGSFSDGFSHGLYAAGSTVGINAPMVDAGGATFAYWSDSLGNIASRNSKATLNVSIVNQIYTANYIKYSQGLEFDSNGDGTCYIISMGDCSDTELIIPPKSPDGDTVIGIDGSAFAGEAITSVSFPNTIEEIARRAFYGCDSITDVYYDGTEAVWEEISISSGNDAILDATMHFVGVIKHTVAFVDYDGTILKTEIVESGNSATAPANPKREGYTFVGWDNAYTNIISDMTVKAIYEEIFVNPTFLVSSAKAVAGQENVEITVALKNNPGITSLLMKIAFDDNALDLVSMTYNTEIGGTSIPNASTSSPVTAYWADGFNDVTGDWTFVTLKFNVSNNAAVGDYAITVSYNADDVYNAAETNISFDIVNGKIAIS